MYSVPKHMTTTYFRIIVAFGLNDQPLFTTIMSRYMHTGVDSIYVFELLGPVAFICSHLNTLNVDLYYHKFGIWELDVNDCNTHNFKLVLVAL